VGESNIGAEIVQSVYQLNNELDDQGSISGKGKIFLFSIVYTSSEAHPAYNPSGSGGLYSRG
jgi:hypothetical protein